MPPTMPTDTQPPLLVAQLSVLRKQCYKNTIFAKFPLLSEYAKQCPGDRDIQSSDTQPLTRLSTTFFLGNSLTHRFIRYLFHDPLLAPANDAIVAEVNVRGNLRAVPGVQPQLCRVFINPLQLLDRNMVTIFLRFFRRWFEVWPLSAKPVQQVLRRILPIN